MNLSNSSLANPLKMKALDLILFRGVDVVGSITNLLQKWEIGEGKWTHAAVIVNSDILDGLEKNKFYLWESLRGGKYGDGVPNIEGKSFFGVQLREYEPVMQAFEKKGGEYKILSVKIDDPTKYKEKFTEHFKTYNNTTYDFNIFSILAALYPRLRCMRKTIEKCLGTERWLFCSELCALTYKDIGLLPNINIKNVVPHDFVKDADHEVEGIFVEEHKIEIYEDL